MAAGMYDTFNYLHVGVVVHALAELVLIDVLLESEMEALLDEEELELTIRMVREVPSSSPRPCCTT